MRHPWFLLGGPAGRQPADRAAPRVGAQVGPELCALAGWYTMQAVRERPCLLGAGPPALREMDLIWVHCEQSKEGTRGYTMGSMARSLRVRARVTPHRGQGESLVPLYTRESVSLWVHWYTLSKHSRNEWAGPALRCWPSLRELDLSWAPIGGKGLPIVPFSVSLKVPPPLSPDFYQKELALPTKI